MSFSNKERTLSMQEGGGGSEGFYQFFKKYFVSQRTMELNISWPSKCFEKNFMTPTINFSFSFKLVVSFQGG